jgi:lysophospholipase L1-like esterase
VVERALDLLADSIDALRPMIIKKTLTLLLAASFLIPASMSLSVAQDANAARFDIPASDEGLPGAGPIRRYDWFKNLWKQRRSAWAKQVKQDQGALVFLGDSITQGWGDDMRGAFGGVKVANRGISGDTTRGVLIRLEEDVLSLNPSGVVLLIGTNDLEERADAETIAGNLKLIVTALKAHNAKMPIVLCEVMPSSASKKRGADQIKQINKLCKAVVKGDAQITVVDTWTLFANAQGDAKQGEFPDLLHPNKAGYAKWEAALRPILATLDFLETEADLFKLEPGFKSLFNGSDLTGWGFRAKKTLKQQAVFDGKKQSNDGRYVAKHGRLIVTTPAEGRRIQQLWTTKEFGNDFVLKLEFRATPNADSGVFIRKPQLQCRDYPLAGPYKDLKKYKPQDWNEMVVTVKGGAAHCTCNGEVLNAAMKVPPTGPIGLEGDRGQMEYRRIRIRELK